VVGSGETVKMGQGTYTIVDEITSVPNNVKLEGGYNGSAQRAAR
jgi:hypothetical protein